MAKFERSRLVQDLIDSLTPLEYQSVISHADMMRALELPSRNRRYYRSMQTVNRELMLRGKLLRAIPSVGYEVVHPDEWIDEAGTHVKRAHRCIRKADRIVVNAPEESMTDAGRNRFRVVNDRIRSMASLVGKERKDVFALIGTTKTNNRTFERLPPPRK